MFIGVCFILGLDHLGVGAQTVPTPTPVPSVPPTPVPTPTPMVPPTPTPLPPPPPISTPTATPVPPTPTPTHLQKIPTDLVSPTRVTPPTLTPTPSSTPTPSPTVTPTPTPVIVELDVTPKQSFWMIFPGDTITVTASVRNAGPAERDVPVRFLVPADVKEWHIVAPRALRLDRQRSAWVLPTWPIGSDITLTLRLTTRPDVPLGKVSDIVLFWPGPEGDAYAVMATLAYPPDHLPAVGGSPGTAGP